jgi:hypothetical protein
MHVHDFSEIKTVDGKLLLQDQLQGMFKYGFSWPQEVKAQENFIARLQQSIDQRTSLLRNFTLPNVEVTVPVILVGPPGIRVILPTLEHGIFRAKEGQWLVQSRNGLKPAKENLLLRTQLYVRATRKFLSDQGFQDITINGMLVGLHPGMHVDTLNPAVRVIQSDAIRRFGSQWVQEPAALTPEQIFQIISVFRRAGEPTPDDEEAITREAPSQPREDQFSKSLEPLQKTFNFNTKQWIVLGGLVAATVLVLLIFMIFILMSL